MLWNPIGGYSWNTEWRNPATRRVYELAVLQTGHGYCAYFNGNLIGQFYSSLQVAETAAERWTRHVAIRDFVKPLLFIFIFLVAISSADELQIATVNPEMNEATKEITAVVGEEKSTMAAPLNRGAMEPKAMSLVRHTAAPTQPYRKASLVAKTRRIVLKKPIKKRAVKRSRSRNRHTRLLLVRCYIRGKSERCWRRFRAPSRRNAKLIRCFLNGRAEQCRVGFSPKR